MSGFYRGAENASDQSLMRSTHESNFAHNVGGRPRRNQPNSNAEESKRMSRKPPVTAGDPHSMNLDPELERIYGTARGLADLTNLSDLEKDSQGSGESDMS